MNITALRGLWEKTTPGEWVIDDHIVNRGDTPDMWHVYEFLEDDPPLATMPYLNAEANARFLAAAHNEMGKLLDVVEAADRVVRTVLTTGASCTDDIRALNAALAKLEG